MSKLTPIMERLTSVDYIGKRQLLEVLLRAVHGTKDKLESGEREAILTYAYGEFPVFIKDILSAMSYKEKDVIFECGDVLLRLIMLLCPTPQDIPQAAVAQIQAFAQLVTSQRYLETALEEMFGGEMITEAQVEKLVGLLLKTRDEYQRGKLYAGLAHFKDSISKMEPGAKALLTACLENEFRRYLEQDSLHGDSLDNLELMVDVCKYFPSSEILSLLRKVMELRRGNINYYAVETFLYLKEAVPQGVITALAEDLEYANLTYRLLCKYGKKELFPGELSDPQYLAKSDMVRWLTYPTELGKVPDKIEYIGKIRYLFKKEVYFVFCYCSDSDTLGEELKNRWLIGWSSEDGGTFSNFDLYELYEGITTAKTLRNIKRKLIGR